MHDHSLLFDICAQLKTTVKPELSSPASNALLDMACELLMDYQTRHCGDFSSRVSPNGSSPAEIIKNYRHNLELYHQQHELQQIDPALRSLPAEEIKQRLHNYLCQKSGKPLNEFKLFKKMAGGFSKETFICALQDSDDFGHGTTFVVRMDVTAGPTDFSVADEYPYLQLAYDGGVPAAKPIFCEIDTEILGNPFALIECVAGAPSDPGDSGVTAWGDDSETREQLGREIAIALAKIHSLAIPEQQLKTVDLKQYFGRWCEKLVAVQPKPEPALKLAFSWLMDNVPPNPEKFVYVHGDFAPYNIMQQDARITAVLDWEFIHPGDASEDLNYCKPYVENLIDWDEFLSVYQQHGGAEYDDGHVAFYTAWRDLRNIVCINQGYRGYCTRGNADIKSLFSYRKYSDIFLSNALKVVEKNS